MLQVIDWRVDQVAQHSEVETVGPEFAVLFAHHQDIAAVVAVLESACHGDGLDDGATVLADIEHLTLIAAYHDNMERKEFHVHDGIVDILPVAQAVLEVVGHLLSALTLHIDTAQDRELDVTLIVHVEARQVGRPEVAVVHHRVVVHTERTVLTSADKGLVIKDFHQFLVLGRNGDGQLVVGLNADIVSRGNTLGILIVVGILKEDIMFA